MSVVTTRMKMRCASKTLYPSNPGPGTGGNVQFTFVAEYDDSIGSRHRLRCR
jgi:hypothetical protein